MNPKKKKMVFNREFFIEGKNEQLKNSYRVHEPPATARSEQISNVGSIIPCMLRGCFLAI